MVTARAITVKFMIPKRPGWSGWTWVIFLCAAAAVAGKAWTACRHWQHKQKRSERAFISVQPIWEKYKHHCFEGRSKSTLKCDGHLQIRKNSIQTSSLERPDCNDNDLSAADKPHHCKHKAFFVFFTGSQCYTNATLRLGFLFGGKHTF